MTSSPDCHAILANISSYLDGELERTACEAIEHHCESCPECARLVHGLRDTIGLCRDAGAAPLPEDVRRLARERVRRLLDRQPRDRTDEP